jgi:hypothetical protein
MIMMLIHAGRDAIEYLMVSCSVVRYDMDYELLVTLTLFTMAVLIVLSNKSRCLVLLLTLSLQYTANDPYI